MTADEGFARGIEASILRGLQQYRDGKTKKRDDLLVEGDPTLTDFLLARIAEDEADRVTRPRNGYLPTPREIREAKRWEAECEAKRQIIEWHKSWPVLVETPPEMESFTNPAGDPSSMVMRMSRQIAWKTEQQYREAFGTEPPTGPVLRFLALPYADHPDYRQEWSA